MEFGTLENTDFQEIIDCSIAAFSDYSIQLPSELEYWKNRWFIGNVDYGLSVGAFYQKKLVALIVTCIQEKEGIKIAYNTLTGVKSSHRGKKLPLEMYNFIIPKLKETGVGRCELEVLQDNFKAIHVYKQIGFNTKRDLISYRGKLENLPAQKVEAHKIDYEYYFKKNIDKKKYSWDFDSYALSKGRDIFQFYSFTKDSKEIGRIAIEMEKKQLAQFYCTEESNFDYALLFGGISKVIPEIRIINIDSKEENLFKFLEGIGLNIFVSQHEMSLDL